MSNRNERRTAKRQLQYNNTQLMKALCCVSAVLFLVGRIPVAAAWGSSSNEVDASVYGNALNRDWLYDGSTISLKLEGCMWGYVEDNEESGCLEDSSEDGTTYWYQMANCRRAQAVYSLYTGSGCGSGFVESFVTTTGVQEFAYYLQSYDANYAYAADDDGAGDDGNGGGGGYDNLPMCEQSDNGSYIGIGCADDGTFNLQYFSDQYCLLPTGTQYDKLRNLNRSLRSYRSCSTIYKNGGNGGGNSLPSMLVSMSDSCSSLDSGLCTDNSAMKSRRSHTSKNRIPVKVGIAGKTWLTKLKYVAAGLLLLASFVMFTGILFTNRRRRRALMQRKYRQSSRKSKSRSSRSKSKSKDGRSSRERSSHRRSKSRRRDTEPEETGGVFT